MQFLWKQRHAFIQISKLICGVSKEAEEIANKKYEDTFFFFAVSNKTIKGIITKGKIMKLSTWLNYD